VEAHLEQLLSQGHFLHICKYPPGYDLRAGHEGSRGVARHIPAQKKTRSKRYLLTCSVAALKTRIVDPLQESDWDDLVGSHPDQLFFILRHGQSVKYKLRSPRSLPPFHSSDKLAALLPLMEGSSTLPAGEEFASRSLDIVTR